MTYHLQSLDPHCSYNSIFIPTDFMSFKINLAKFFVTFLSCENLKNIILISPLI